MAHLALNWLRVESPLAGQPSPHLAEQLSDEKGEDFSKTDIISAL